jgi:hypothetical protein
MGLLNWFKLNWFQKDPLVKRATRYAGPGLTAFYWDGGLSPGRPIKDVSVSGAYVITAERWYVGTILTTSLKADRVWAVDGKPASFTVPCKVVRHGTNGMGVSFVFRNVQEQKMLERFMKTVLGDYSVGESPREKRNSAGSSLVEFALVMPLLFLLMVSALNFGGLIYAWIEVQNAARGAVQYSIMDFAYKSSPTSPSGTQVTSLVSSDFYSLLGGSSPTIAICYDNTNVTPAVTTISGSCPGPGLSAIPSDPEPASYTLAVVDISYTYTPFIEIFDFSSLGIHIPPPFGSAITIHRRVVMRFI